MESTPKIPVLLVDNDKWSRDSYVVFEDDQIIGGCIPSEWVDEKFDAICDEAREMDEPVEITREQVASEMDADFFAENSDIDEYWPQYHILRAGDNYYRYTEDGMAHFISEDEALEAMPSVQEQRIQEWQNEQNQISSSEIITPRQAGVMNHFGVDEAEQNELADDTTVLRKYNGRLYVYEAQLGDPAQWRLLQTAPHMPTGTLPRPAGA